MSQIQEVDRSLVVVFDIEGYSQKTPQTQANLVSRFIEHLTEKLKRLKAVQPDAFSTGDGAIVSVGRNCRLDKQATRLFVDFVIDFALSMLKEGLVLRTAVNYSEKDRVVIIDEAELIEGRFIQTGDTINIATRVLSFCDPREIMIHESVHNFLRLMSLEKAYPFTENGPFRTKHGVELKTYTYDPPEDQRDYFYAPDSPAHRYKKFSYFPRIKNSLIEHFRRVGLEFELIDVISYAFQSMQELNRTNKFVSWHSVIDILVNLRYDSSDSVYVLSRQDRASGFWTQPRINRYITYLRTNAGVSGGHINQTRVRIYDATMTRDLMPTQDIYWQLRKLHRPGTYFMAPSFLDFGLIPT